MTKAQKLEDADYRAKWCVIRQITHYWELMKVYLEFFIAHETLKEMNRC